jgi:GAF domain-containing protein
MAREISNEERYQDLDRILREVSEALSLTEESRQINELEALQLLLEVTRAIHNIHNIHDLVTLVLDSVIAFADGDRAFLMLFDDETGELRFKMGRNRSQTYLSYEEFTPSMGVIDKTLSKGRALIVPDAQADGDLSKRSSILNLQLRSIMCAPLMVKGETIGLLYVDSNRNVGRYSAAHLNVITSLADQSAVAIRNAQKFETHN